jgi:hypothetical protein
MACLNGCQREVHARGMCKACYQRVNRRVDFVPIPKPSPDERFWSKVNKNGPLMPNMKTPGGTP